MSLGEHMWAEEKSIQNYKAEKSTEKYLRLYSLLSYCGMCENKNYTNKCRQIFCN